MLVVIAIGGKGLLGAEGGLEAEAHRAGARAVVDATAGVARHHNVVVTHGSAPQVGLLAYQSALSRQVTGYPLDIVEAETEGFLGYVLQQALQNELRDRDVATVLTQVQVDPNSAGYGRHRTAVVAAATSRPHVGATGPAEVANRVPAGMRQTLVMVDGRTLPSGTQSHLGS